MQRAALVLLFCFVLGGLVLGASKRALDDKIAVSMQSIVSDTFYLGSTYHDNAFRTSQRSIVIDDSQQVHVAWVNQPIKQYGSSHGVYSNVIADGTVQYPPQGCNVGQVLSYLATVSLDLDSTAPVVARSLGNRIGIHHGYPDSCAWTYWDLLATTGAGSPVFSIQEQYPTSMYHLIAGGGQFAFSYWRTPLGTSTRRTVEATGVSARDITTSPVSQKAAIVVSAADGIHYYESLDAGLTWGGGTGFGIRHSIGALETEGTLSVAYDYNDELHIIFESHFGSRGVFLKHWSLSTGITTAAEATWEYPSIETDARDISYPQLGVGVGGNLNNLYLVWSQFGSLGNNSDTSSGGQSNSDIYLSISTNGGASWDPARNLTNTATPDCNGDCGNEIIPSLAEIVDSFLYIQYVRDLRPGLSTPDTATRTQNPVYYLRVQTPNPIAAPRLSGLPSQIGPLYLKFRSQDTAVFTIENPGTAPLDFVIQEDESWLSFVPGLDSLSGSILPGGPAQEFTLAIDVTGLPNAIHQGLIHAVSNDPSADSVEVTVIADLISNIVGHFRFGTSAGTGCWGWTAPDGSEYALMGTTGGITVVDATRLRVVATVPGPGPCGYSHREIKTYKHYAYAASECSGLNEGLMVIDLQYLPDSVHFLGAYAPLSVDLSHNITIDTATGYAYQAGPSTLGIWTRSLLNPAAPVHIFSMPTECHDLFARNDTLWVAEGNGGSFAVWNVSNKTSPTLIARVQIPSSGYVHNISISDDGQIAATTEETVGKTVKFWDISDLTDVQLLGQYLASGQSAHNVHIEGQFAVIAHYTNGVKVLDISNPASPTVIGSFDTHPASDDPGFDGCWGVYPYTKNGWVYASNMDGNFYILQFDELMTTCDCPCHADPQCDGVRSNVQDVVGVIEIVFRAGASAQGPDCPMQNADVNCSGVADIVDVVKVIDVAFRGINPTVAYCAPCE